MDQASDVASRLEALEALLSAQAERIDEQARVIDSLRTELATERPGAPAVAPAGPVAVGRRELLGSIGKVAAGAVAGSAAAVIATASPAAAAGVVSGVATGTTNGVEGTTGVATAAGVSAVSTSGALASPALAASNSATTGTSSIIAVLATVTGAGARAVVGDASNTGTGIGVNGIGGVNGVKGTTGVASGVGVLGQGTGTNGVGVQGEGPFGVRGTTQSVGGFGVVGEVSVPDSCGGRFSGPRADLQVGAGANGLPGPSRNKEAGHLVGQLAMETAAGQLWLCVASSNPGIPGYAGKRLAVQEGGSFVNTASAAAATATSTLAGQPAVAATNDAGVAVRAASANGTAVVGTGGAAGLGGQLGGGVANVRLVGGASGPNRNHALGHQVGELAMETNGTLWVCVATGAAGQPGAWKRLSYVEDLPPGFDPGSLNGVFSAPPKPGRVYDSRNGDGKISGGQSRNVSVATTLEGSEIVPVGASAAVFTITLDQTEGGGFLSVFPSNVVFPGTSSINWFANGQILANGGTVTVPADRTLTVLAGGAGSTHFLIDITGVYT